MHQTSMSQRPLRSSTNLVIRLCFLSLCPVNILHSTKETLTEPGWVPSFPRAWSPPSRFSLGLFQLHRGKKVTPASNTDDLDKKIHRKHSTSYDFMVFLHPGWWESCPHTPAEGVLFLKGTFSLSPSCQRGLSCILCQLRERESRGTIPREISLPNPVLEVGVVSTLYIEGNRPREQKY